MVKDLEKWVWLIIREFSSGDSHNEWRNLRAWKSLVMHRLRRHLESLTRPRRVSPADFQFSRW